MKSRLTSKVKRGLWLIVARSATVMEAESDSRSMDKEERECVLAACRYACDHWDQRQEATNADVSESGDE